MTGPDHAASGDRHNAYHGGIGASDGQVLTTGGERDGRRPLLLFCVSQRPLRVRLHVFGSMPRLYVAWQRPLMANTEPENGEGKRTRPVAREVVSGSGSARLETTSSAILPSTSRDLCHWISCGPRPCSSAERRVKVFSSPIATNRPSDFGIRWQRSTRRLTRHITIHHSGSVIAHGGGDSCDGMEWIHGGLGARAGGRGDLVSPQAGRTGSTGLTHAVNGVVRSPEPAFSS